MRLNLSSIIEVPGGSVPFECELETDGLDFPSVRAYVGKPHAEGRVFNEAGILHLEGTLTAEMICVCDRCLRLIPARAAASPTVAHSPVCRYALASATFRKISGRTLDSTR